MIGRALDAGYEPLSVLVEKKQMEENEETIQIMNRFDDTKVSIFTADFEVLTKLTGFKLTRGMLCAMRRKPLLGDLYSEAVLLCTWHKYPIPAH